MTLRAADGERRARASARCGPGGRPARPASRSRRCTAPCRCWRSRCSPSTSATTLLDPFPPHRRAQRGRPLPDGLSPAVARARDRRLRPAARAGDDEPRPPAARLPRLARRCTGSPTRAGRSRWCTGSARARTPRSTWMLALTLACVGAVAGRARRAARRARTFPRALRIGAERRRGARGARARDLAPAGAAGARLGAPRRNPHRGAGGLLAARPRPQPPRARTASPAPSPRR